MIFFCHASCSRSTFTGSAVSSAPVCRTMRKLFLSNAGSLALIYRHLGFRPSTALVSFLRATI